MRLISVLTYTIDKYTRVAMILLFVIVNWKIKKKSKNNKKVNHRNIKRGRTVKKNFIKNIRYYKI